MDCKQAPFGTTTMRFGKNTAHPNLDRSGLYVSRPIGCDPCLYNPHLIKKPSKINKDKTCRMDPWKYKSELEDWSKNLGYRNQKVLEQKKWFNSLLGPAWHYVSEPTKYQGLCLNVSFGRTSRFKTFTNLNPNPGTYYKKVPFKTSYGPHSRKPTFDMQDPCRFKDTSPKWSLAPNRYKIVDKDSIEHRSKRIVSLRGPYDLFTGPRDGSTIKNHFNTSLVCSAANWPVALNGSFETYNKSLFGVMNKTNRDTPCRSRNMLVELPTCFQKPSEPGPVDLQVDKPKVFKKNVHGFNSSYNKPPGYRRVDVWPGVGRYNIKTIGCGIAGHGHRHVFLSKQGRTIGAIQQKPMNTF